MSDQFIGKWNYRVIRSGPVFDEYGFAIHECHYDNGTEPDSVPHSWSKDAVSPFGSTLGDLSDDLDRMRRALDKPVLEEHNGKLREVK